jgi:hypothetical protein
MPSVFINYRVVDQSYGAAAIDDALAERFGRDRVFRDCVSMAPGVDYPQAMREALRHADVLVVVIGPNWLTAVDGSVRLIDRQRDWVRWEIEHALAQGKHVIPVLLRDDGRRHATMPTADELPPSIRQLAHKMRLTLSQRSLRSDLNTLIERLIKLVPALVVADLFEPPAPPGPASSAGSRLAPEHLVVPFQGRESPLADLHAWATNEASAAALLLTGPAGIGKKRLALRLCAALTGQAWQAGLVPAAAAATSSGRTAEVHCPVLAVVDVAESRPEQVRALAEAFARRSPGRDQPARLLLLSRSDGQWLTDLVEQSTGRTRDLLSRVRRSTLSPCSRPEQRLLGSAAREALADWPGAPPAVNPLPVPDHDATPLAVILAARIGGEDPLGRLLTADRLRWRRSARESGQAHLTTAGLSAVATVATLCRPSSPAEAAALQAQLPLLLGLPPGRIAEYVEWLGRLYPAHYAPAAVRPTALGDRIVAATLAADPSLITTLAGQGTPQQLTNALTVLGQAMPRHPDLATAVTAAIRVDPARLVSVGVTVTARLAQPEPFARAIAAAVDGGPFTTFAEHIELLERVGRSGPGLNPLLAASLRALRSGAEDLVQAAAPPDATAEAWAATIRNVGDALTDSLVDTVSGIMDPASGRMPTQDDGRPLVPPLLADALRMMIDRGWLGSGNGGPQ